MVKRGRHVRHGMEVPVERVAVAVWVLKEISDKGRRQQIKTMLSTVSA